MKLIRTGANRRERDAVLIDGGAKSPHWDSRSKVVRIKAVNQTDPSLKGEYDYTLELTLSDVVDIISVLSEFSIKSSSHTLEKALSGASLPLLRLLVLSSGLAQKPEEQDIMVRLGNIRGRTDAENANG